MTTSLLAAIVGTIGITIYSALAISFTLLRRRIAASSRQLAHDLHAVAAE